MINMDLAEIVAFPDVYALRCQERPTVKELRMKVREVLQWEAPALNLSMNQWIDKFIREQGGNADWELSTRHAMHTFQRHIRLFGKAHDLDYFDADGITAFIKYLREKAQLQEVSVKKQYKNLVWFLNWALRNKYTNQQMNAALKDLCELCGINEPIRKSKYVNGSHISDKCVSLSRYTTYSL